MANGIRTKVAVPKSKKRHVTSKLRSKTECSAVWALTAESHPQRAANSEQFENDVDSLFAVFGCTSIYSTLRGRCAEGEHHVEMRGRTNINSYFARLAILGALRISLSSAAFIANDRMCLCKRNTHASELYSMHYTLHTLNRWFFVFRRLTSFAWWSSSTYKHSFVSARPCIVSLAYYFVCDVFFLSHSLRRRSFSFRIDVGVRWLAFRFGCVLTFFRVLCFPLVIIVRFMCSPSSFSYSPVCTCRFALYTPFIPYVLYALGIHCLSVRCNAFW